MFSNRLLTALFIGSVLVLVLGSGVAHVTAEPTRMTIDDGHELATDTKKSEFHRTGTATATMMAPQMSITMSDEHESKACEISGFHSDTRNDFLCISYEEEIDRSFRIFIPNEYFSPYVRKSVEPAEGNVKATFEPVQDGEYTAVTFTLTEPGTYAWPITKEASWFSGMKDRNVERMENITGVGVTEQESWSYIKPEQLGGNKSAYVVQAPNGTKNVVMEYKTGPEEWAAVPDESKSYAPVYYDTKREMNNRVYVFATTTEPPEVRYKTKAGSRDQISAAFREIGQAPARLEEILSINIPFVGN